MLEDVYPLSPLQEGLFYHWLQDRNSTAYVEQISFHLAGDLHVGFLEKAYKNLISRHPVLRTCFTLEYGERPLQVVRKEAKAVFEYRNVTDDTVFNLTAFKQQDRVRSFDLTRGSQIRLSILETGIHHYEFVWTFHHIIMDGWCLTIVMRDFFSTYHSLTINATPQLKEVFPYSNYIKWLEKIDKKKSLEFWKEYLDGYAMLSGIPQKSGGFDENRVVERVSVIGNVSTERIKKMCRGFRITESCFMQTMWGVLLAKYNNTQDVAFGTVVSGRPDDLEGAEEMIGLFINTVPVRIRVNDAYTVRQLLLEVQHDYIRSIPFQFIQLADIQKESQPGRDLFNHIVVYENYPEQQVMEGYGSASHDNNDSNGTPSSLQLVSVETFHEGSYDFLLTIVPGEEIRLKFSFNPARYDSRLVEYVQNNLIHLIDQVLENPDSSIQSLDVVSKQEKDVVLTWGSGSVTYPMDKTIVGLFEHMAATFSDRIAIIYNERQLTYRELNGKANRLAHYLSHNFDVSNNDLVAIKLDRSEWSVISLLGVLKTGAAYVPIDVSYPEDRISYMLSDSSCFVNINQELLTDFWECEEKYSSTNPGLNAKPDDLAYVVYTSGSTGMPKGVMITHRSLLDYSYGILAKTNIGECRIFGLVSTLAADLGNTVIYPSLLTGGTLHVFSAAEVKDPDTMSAAEIDCLKIVPSHWKALQADGKLWLPRKSLIFGGEQLTEDILKQIALEKTQCRVYNHYGPSETTIGKLIKKIDFNASHYAVSLGTPIGNNEVYILTPDCTLVPVGVKGEICIGGDGLAKGYLNKDSLTAGKFVNNPFKADTLMFRTGDLGKWLPDGTVEFGGRNDDQVKIRGYRIELGEIEHVLLQYGGVSEAVVIARKDSRDELQLVAYVTGIAEHDVKDVEHRLREKLPPYMIPFRFVTLEKLPITLNGKVDRKALPVGTFESVEFVGPSNAIEERLVSIWSEVLGVEREKISTRQHFFELGGHSLTAIRIVLRIREQLSVDIDLNAFFKDPVIEVLAKEIHNVLWLRSSAESGVVVEKVII